MDDFFELQTQAIVDATIEDILSTNGFNKVSTESIEDEYFALPEDLEFPIHTFEKSGYLYRIRNGKKEKHRLVLADPKLIHRVKQLCKDSDYPDNIILIDTSTKQRQIWAKDNSLFTVIVDIYPTNIIIEIKSEAQTKSEFKKIIGSHEKFIKKLGISEKNIITDSYMFRKIHYKIKSDPKIKLGLLEVELKELTAKLREKEMLSGESFKDTGDGWHENPTYETIYHEILSLNAMIIDTKEEIIRLRILIQG